MQRSGEFVLFNVLYEDGTRSSDRKVPSSELGSLDGAHPRPGQCAAATPMTGTPEAPGLLTLSRRRAYRFSSLSALIV